MRLHFSRNYLIIFAMLFSVELFIALFVTDQFVRPFVGDMLVVGLLFAFIRIFFSAKSEALLALGVLLFACTIEAGQYYGLVDRLGLSGSTIARVVIGTTFDAGDLLAYATGFIAILAGIKLAKFWAGQRRKQVTSGISEGR